MTNKLAQHFSFPQLLNFALPSIAMMIFTSSYSIADGFFVSNFAGSDSLAAVNIVWPICLIMSSGAYILGIGGTALVSAVMGEGKVVRARRIFSMLYIVGAIFGIVVTIAGLLLVGPASTMMGAEGSLHQLCMDYGMVIMMFMLPIVIMEMSASFYVAAGKPMVGLVVSLVSGCLNIGLDALFIVGMKMGVLGAAWGTGLASLAGGVIPVIYFLQRKNKLLFFSKPLWDMRALGKACVNGVSEFVTNVSASVVVVLYNYQLMRYLGPDGVAAYSAIDYINFIFVAIFLGYAMGTEPLISYNYGAQNHDELKSLFRKSLVIIGVSSVAMITLAQLSAEALTTIFVGYDPELAALTLHGFRIFAISFLFCGLNIYGSGFFTGLNNGLVSAALSFVRTLICESGCILLLPLLFGGEGIWFSVVVAEVLAFVLTIGCFIGFRKRYQYA